MAIALLLAACSSDDSEPQGSGGSGGATSSGGSSGVTTTSCDYGTMYPAANVIDPDNPLYSDASITQQEVTDKFATAKAQNTSAYRAYRAARDNVGYMPCAYCKCGCGSSIGHESAIDCFKDMHGFG
jgi:hypothetical protein